MNLIEQLGGYEASKNILLRKKYDHVAYSVDSNSFYDHEAAEHGGIDIRDLDDELLEYRRQHNIFEVGDYFCYESKYLSNDPLDGDAYKKLNQLDSIDFECGFVESALKRGGIIRHATDEEIKAGKRLEVDQ